MPRTPLRMPKMSMTMESGELATWHVSVGDHVAPGQVVCEVMTDKVDMEVEATAAGTVVELVAEPGDSVPVGEPLAWLDATADGLLDDLLDGGSPGEGEPSGSRPTGSPPTGSPPSDGPPSGGSPSDSSPSDSSPADSPPGDGSLHAALHDAISQVAESYVAHSRAAGTGGADGIVPAIPGARRLAAENGVDLRSLPGTGPGGAVLMSDVREHLDQVDRSRTAASLLGTPRTAAPQPALRQLATSQTEAAPPSSESPVDADALWAARAAALAPRAAADATGPGAVLWRDVVLPPGAPPAADALRPALLVAVSRALATEGLPHVRRRPRVGLAVPSPAGPVTVTFSDLHRLPAEAAAVAVRVAVDEVGGGSVDVGLLAPPDVVVTWVGEADRVAPPPPAGPEGPWMSVGAGGAAPRVVPVDDGIGVRPVVTLAVAAAQHADAARAGRLLARAAEALAAGLAGPHEQPASTLVRPKP